MRDRARDKHLQGQDDASKEQRNRITKTKTKQITMKAEDNFIQWKATDVFIEFTCKCGEYNNYSGFFAYYVKCSGCDQVYKMDTKIKMEKTNKTDCKPLESDA